MSREMQVIKNKKPESVTPSRLLSVAVMLACNGFITGQTINVNGGRYLG
jgi:hypothetical protein